MFDLRKLLTKKSKINRNRRYLLNVQIACIAWIAEVMAGVIGTLMVFFPFYSISISAREGQIVTDAIYFVILPSIFLINSRETKSSILENQLYLKFTNQFFYHSVNKIIPDNDENEDVDKKQKFCESCGEELIATHDKENCNPFKSFPESSIFQ